MAGIPPLVRSIEKDNGMTHGSTDMAQDRETMPTLADSALSGSAIGSSSPSTTSHSSDESDIPPSLQDAAKATVMLQLRLLQVYYCMPDAGRIAIEQRYGPSYVANVLWRYNRLRCYNLMPAPTWIQLAVGDMRRCGRHELPEERMKSAENEQALLRAEIHHLENLEEEALLEPLAGSGTDRKPSNEAVETDRICGISIPIEFESESEDGSESEIDAEDEDEEEGEGKELSE